MPVPEARRYWRCHSCCLTWLDARHHLSPADEHAHYAHHQNDEGDPGYRRFLNRLAAPLLDRIAPASAGLDYGCGPGPALAAMLGEAGHRMAVYDPYFAPDRTVLDRGYDFVTCTEVAEHFRAPAADFAAMMARVRPGGWLAIMTCFQEDDAQFASWHYRRDPTHIAFYRAATFAWLAAAHGWTLTIPAKDVALLQRPLGQ